MPEVCIVLFHRVYKKVHPLEIDEILLKKVKMKCKDINLEGLQCLLRNRMDLLLLSEKIFDIRLIHKSYTSSYYCFLLRKSEIRHHGESQISIVTSIICIRYSLIFIP